MQYTKRRLPGPSILCLGVFAILVPSALFAQTDVKQTNEPTDPVEVQRINNSSTVFNEIMDALESTIPKSILQKTSCIAVFPGVLNAAFIVGGRYGKGVVSCRVGSEWSSPAFLKMKGGSIGWQIGGQSTDYVLLFMSDKSLDSMFSSKLTLGTEALVAAGPVGRTAAASTDTNITAKILSYSRTKGLFAGLALNGVSIAQDDKATRNVYGKKAKSAQIVKDRSSLLKTVELFPNTLKSRTGASEAK